MLHNVTGCGGYDMFRGYCPVPNQDILFPLEKYLIYALARGHIVKYLQANIKTSTELHALGD